jgi:hypothetical protein
MHRKILDNVYSEMSYSLCNGIGDIFFLSLFSKISMIWLLQKCFLLCCPSKLPSSL